MSEFSFFNQFVTPRLGELRAVLAEYPLHFRRDRTPQEWLDGMDNNNPVGLVALHRAYADYLEASFDADPPDELYFLDWVWLLGLRLYTDCAPTTHERSCT